jgi:hypothetical protein
VPSGRQHRSLTRAALGWDIPEVHALIDAASSYLGGRHRVVGHNLAMLRLVEEMFGRRGRLVFTLHVLQDAGHYSHRPVPEGVARAPSPNGGVG